VRAIRNFDEFLREKIVKKHSIDKSRAEFLIKESENSYINLLEKIQKITDHFNVKPEDLRTRID
jgi:ribosomal protein S15P/S13E